MADLQVSIKAGTLMVKSSFDLYEPIKELPAGRWSKSSKAWKYPATVAVARNIRDMARATSAHATGDTSFHQLLNLVNLQDEAQKIKQHACSAACPQWHHQGEALRFAMPQPAVVLNMATGTGKTKTTIDLIAQRGHQLVLVITKKKAVTVWQKDVAKFLGADAMNVVQLDTGSVPKNLALAQAAILDTSKPIVLVTNYQSMWREPFAAWILEQNIDLVVLDEGHTIKAPGGKASKFMQQLRLRVPAIVELTATFMGDKPTDMYGQMRAIDAGVFGTSFSKFRDKYCIMGGYLGKEILGYKNQDEMMARVAPFLYQVDKSVLKLLPVRTKTFYTQLSADAYKTYKRFESEAFTELETGVISADNILVKLLRLQQMTGGFIQPDDADELVQFDTAKADLLKEVLADLPESEGCEAHAPVVIYCKFTQDLRMIRQVADELGYTYAEISGRIDQQAEFKSGAANLLGCQIDAGGTGIDGLQNISSIAIYYSTGYSLTTYIQSLGRLDRPGQENSVLNLHLVCENTIDEEIIAALEAKQDVIQRLLDKVKHYQTIT